MSPGITRCLAAQAIGNGALVLNNFYQMKACCLRILTIFVGIVTVAVLAWSCQPDVRDTAAPSPSRMTSQQSVIDECSLGKIAHSFTIENHEKSTVTYRLERKSCGCVSIASNGTDLSLGGEFAIGAGDSAKVIMSTPKPAANTSTSQHASLICVSDRHQKKIELSAHTLCKPLIEHPTSVSATPLERMAQEFTFEFPLRCYFPADSTDVSPVLSQANNMTSESAMGDIHFNITEVSKKRIGTILESRYQVTGSLTTPKGSMPNADGYVLEVKLAPATVAPAPLFERSTGTIRLIPTNPSSPRMPSSLSIGYMKKNEHFVRRFSASTADHRPLNLTGVDLLSTGLRLVSYKVDHRASVSIVTLTLEAISEGMLSGKFSCHISGSESVTVPVSAIVR